MGLIEEYRQFLRNRHERKRREAEAAAEREKLREQYRRPIATSKPRGGGDIPLSVSIDDAMSELDRAMARLDRSMNRLDKKDWPRVPRDPFYQQTHKINMSAKGKNVRIESVDGTLRMWIDGKEVDPDDWTT